MNDIQALRCPSCGGPLNFDGHDENTIRCGYCGTSLTVPENLRGGREEEIFGSLSSQVAGIQRIGEMVRAGRKIDAIKLYRETFDVDLKEAKEAIDALASGSPVHTRQINIETYSSSEEFPSVFDPATLAAMQTAGRTAAKTGQGCGRIISFTIFIAIALAGYAIWSAFSGSATLFNLLGVDNPLTADGGIALPPLSGDAPLTTVAFASPIETFGGEGVGPGYFSDARGLGLDAAGNFYISDYETGQVQVLSASGEFISQWKIEQGYILSLATARDGTVYLNNGGKILVYNGHTAEYLTEYNVSNVHLFNDLAVTLDGSLVATWNKGGADSVMIFDVAGLNTPIAEDVIHGATGDAELHPMVAVDGQGNLYMLGSFNHAVVKLSPTGVVLARFGSDGSDPGQFRAPTAIAVDNQGRIYVADIFGIQVFDETGRYLDKFSATAGVRDMIFNDANELFVLTIDQTLVKYVLNSDN